MDKPRASIVDQVMRECNNFFYSGQSEGGRYVIESGVIPPYDPDRWVVGQYVLLEGSLMHDGVYLLEDTQITLQGATSEPEFAGRIRGLAPPLDFLELCLDIQAYIDSNTSSKTGRLQDPSLISESYRGYSYAKSYTGSGAAVTWAGAYADRLNKYRKMPTPERRGPLLTPDLLFERDMERRRPWDA